MENSMSGKPKCIGTSNGLMHLKNLPWKGYHMNHLLKLFNYRIYSFSDYLKDPRFPFFSMEIEELIKF